MLTQNVCSVATFVDKEILSKVTDPLALSRVNENHENYLTATYLILSSLCGASTVAIDNKIEQAMDLVKSHLMYAVREEVEVLKEQIKELIEKNSQLEAENAMLKNAASAETLARLSKLQSKPSHTPTTATT